MSAENSGSGLASAFTDLMTSLAVIFILLLVASLNNIKVEGEATKTNIAATLREELNKFIKGGVEIQPDPNDPLSLLVIVPEGLLEFEVNKSDIPPAGVDFLQEFTPKLMQTTCDARFRDKIDSIVIEGHTDSTGGEAINLPLSQGRSMEVVKQSLKTLEPSFVSPSSLGLKECFLGFVSASGRGSANPIKDKDGNEDMGRSRRVIYRIRMRSIEQRQQFERNLLVPAQDSSPGR